ncbi:MAG TPA: response regulator transcription factor [Terriglobales bacterium]|nr:response regulator transcription factor [Terriglobales bacterium]
MGVSSCAPSQTIGVLVADSNRMEMQLLVSALRRHPEYRVFSCPMQVDAVLEHAESGELHVALLASPDVRENGIDMGIIRRLHLSHPEIAKVVLTDAEDQQAVTNAFRSGARGIFSFSESHFRTLCKCINCVHRGQTWANSTQLQYLLDMVTQVPALRVLGAGGRRLLTAREEQVVALVADGLSNREIAGELNLSEHTIKKYIFRIFDKLGLSNRVELVLYAMNNSGHRDAEWMAGVHPSQRV